MNLILAWVVLVIVLIFSGLLPGTDLVVWSFFLFLAGLFIALPQHSAWPWWLALLPSSVWFFVVARRAVSAVVYLARAPDFVHKLLAAPRLVFYTFLIFASAYFAGGFILIFSGLGGAWRGAKLWQDTLGSGLLVSNWTMDVLFNHHRHVALTTFYRLLSAEGRDAALTVVVIAALAGTWAALVWPKQFGWQHLLVHRLKAVMDPPKADGDEHLRGGRRS